MSEIITAAIIEDDPMVREINKRYLLKDGRIGAVRTYSSGQEALTTLAEHPVPLILLDVYMPRLNGLDFLKQLRIAGITSDIIMVTAANDFASMEKALQLGALDYLVKPFEYERLTQALDKFFYKLELQDKTAAPLSQKEADELFSKQDSYGPKEMVKGIQQRTLDVVKAYITEHAGTKYSGNELAKLIGLSRVTVHKYLNYLESKKMLISEIDYETEGRPRLLYYVKPGQK